MPFFRQVDKFDYAPTEPPLMKVEEWPKWDGPLGKLPRTRAETIAVFGNPGVGKVDRKWKSKNLIVAKNIPLSPHKKDRRLYCHRLAEPYIREGLRRVSVSCPDFKITTLGCFNFRHQRHDPRRPLSEHAFATALDINHGQNRGIYFKRGEAPGMFSDEWWDTWPEGIPEAAVRALQSVGFAWGADWDEDGETADHRYMDPMHFELRDRSK